MCVASFDAILPGLAQICGVLGFLGLGTIDAGLTR